MVKSETGAVGFDYLDVHAELDEFINTFKRLNIFKKYVKFYIFMTSI